jgi:hypothetical protein
VKRRRLVVSRWFRLTSRIALVAAAPAAARAQTSPVGTILPNVKMGGSANVRVLGHLPLGGFFRVADVALEQDTGRPFAYAAQSLDRTGFTAIDVSDPEHARVLLRWTIDHPLAHRGIGAVRARYFRSGGGTYLALGTSFDSGSTDADLAAVIFDVSGLPDTSRVREVARLRLPEAPGGVRDLFAYKHADGRALLFVAAREPFAEVYDVDALVAGRGAAARVGRIPIPSFDAHDGVGQGYSGMFVGYDPATGHDKFYGAGAGGYFVYDVTDVGHPRLLTSVVGAAGVLRGSSIAPSPDGRYAVAATGYQYSPLRIFDLSEGLRGLEQTVSRPVGAWTADWRDAVRTADVRWPLVFVSSYEDGLQIFNMVDPANPVTVGWYYTCLCAHQMGFGSASAPQGTSTMNGAVSVDVRNRDGVIAVADANSGFWLLRLDGFSGWRGDDWGMPNMSSAQDWSRAAVAKPVIGATP